jgi:ribosomal protein S26
MPDKKPDSKKTTKPNPFAKKGAAKTVKCPKCGAQVPV